MNEGRTVFLETGQSVCSGRCSVLCVFVAAVMVTGNLSDLCHADAQTDMFEDNSVWTSDTVSHETGVVATDIHGISSEQ